MEIGLWRAGKGFYEVMRLKSIRLSQIERCMCGKREVNLHLIRPLHPQSNIEEGTTLWYEVIWAGMVWESLWRLRERCMQTNIVKFWMREWWRALKSWILKSGRDIFSRTMTQNTPPGWPQLGFNNDIIVIHWPAQSSDLNPIEPLWYHVKCKLQEYEILPKECMNCGREWQRSGIKYY